VVAADIEAGSLTFLDKELFTDLSAGDRHEVDLLAKCRLRGQTGNGREAFFLIHVETQASAQPDFAERMFRYFARLSERHRLPVYPVALLTYDAPLRPEPDQYEVTISDLDVLAFRFRAIQLNRLDWRAFARRPNPVAAALMTKMRIEPADRPRVKLERLRLLVTLKLDPARQAMIRNFMDAYLRLSATELAVYDREVQAIEPPEREAVMRIFNEWETRGEAKIVARLLGRRFGELPEALRDAIACLPGEKVEALADALLDFVTLADVERWVASESAG
jgi:hypothetical protein